MQTTFALAALAAVAFARPQATDDSGAVTAAVSPTGSAPATAQTSYPSPFQLTVVNITATANSKVKRQSTCGQEGTLTTTLSNGVLTDSQGRTGYIADNYQFQYDSPPQAGAIYTAGFSVLSNNSLALGSSAVFYSCYTGGFSNLYDRNWAPQCSPVLLVIIPCSGSSSASAGVSQITDGQPQVTSVVTAVSQISDGQVQATTAVTTLPMPLSQISDGQIQMPTGAPVVSQISDGQVQATAQASSAPVVSQIGDGQIQVTSQVPSVTSAPVVSQISDGQIQVTSAARTTSRPATVSNATATSTPVAFTGAANGLSMVSSLGAVVAGVAAMIFL